VETVRLEKGADGKEEIDWVMGTASDTRGNLPMVSFRPHTYNPFPLYRRLRSSLGVRLYLKDMCFSDRTSCAVYLSSQLQRMRGDADEIVAGSAEIRTARRGGQGRRVLSPMDSGREGKRDGWDGTVNVRWCGWRGWGGWICNGAGREYSIRFDENKGTRETWICLCRLARMRHRTNIPTYGR
jgi:hypothetical protein